MNTSKFLLSIVIPVYNVEKYINKCLLSIFNQKYQQDTVEVIIVNDGTKDDSMKIVMNYVGKIPNIKVCNQHNQGLSIARNNGLNLACGQYVWFVDSDDSLTGNAINIILDVIKNNVEADMFSTRLIRVQELDGKAVVDERSSYFNACNNLPGREYLFNGGCHAPIQQFIYKRSFLLDNALLFYPNIYHEDGQFNVRALYLCKNIYLVEDPVYNYLLRNSGSIMTSLSLKNAEYLITIHRTLIQFGKEKVDKSDIRQWQALITEFLSLIFYWMYPFVDDLNFRNFMKMHKKYIGRHIWACLYSKRFSLYRLKHCFFIWLAPLCYLKILNYKKMHTKEKE